MWFHFPPSSPLPALSLSLPLKPSSHTDELISSDGKIFGESSVKQESQPRKDKVMEKI
jgi:hypothetical protein